MGNTANVVFVAPFLNQIVCFLTTSWDRKRKGTTLFLLQTRYVQMMGFPPRALQYRVMYKRV